MLHLRYLAGFWIALISEYTRIGNTLEFLNIPGLHKDLNDIFHDSFLNKPWILNMPGLQKILHKILHHRYFKGLWICLELWTCQCYTRLCRKQQQESKYALSYKGFWIKCFIVHIWHGSEYNIPWFQNMLGFWLY